MIYEEDQIRETCGRLLSGRAESEDELLFRASPELASEVRSRLEAVGVRLHRSEEAPICVVDDDAEDDGLAEISLACLAICALTLTGESGKSRARLEVKEIWKRVGERDGYTEAYLRRAGLGPLEKRGLVKVIKASQRASQAYVVAGPALSCVDVDGLRARLSAAPREFSDAA